MLRRHARGGTSLSAGQRSRRSPVPGPIGSSGSSRRASCARPGSSSRSSSHDHLYLLSSACIRCGPSMPGLLGQLPAVRPRLPRQRPHVIQRRRDAAPLPHHPAQHPPDQRIRSLPALRGIFYAGHCGRGRCLVFSQNPGTSHGRPALHARPARRQPPAPVTHRHIAACQAVTEQEHANTQRETATVILTSEKPVVQTHLRPPKLSQLDGTFETLIGDSGTAAGNHPCMLPGEGSVPGGQGRVLPATRVRRAAAGTRRRWICGGRQDPRCPA